MNIHYSNSGATGAQGPVGPKGDTGPVAGSANQVVYKDGSNNPAGSADLTFDGTKLSTSLLAVTNSGGDEGGEIFLKKAVTNTTLNNGVTIDVYQNKLRFFEQGGTARGYYVDISQGAPGVGSSLIGPTGPTGPSAAASLSTASYLSTVTQGPWAVNSINTLTLNSFDWQSGITLQNNSQIKMNAAGKYNIAFSAQLQQTLSSGTINIWLAKNGNPVPNTNTRINIAASNPFQAAAWNFFVDANAGDYYELMLSSDSNHTVVAAASAAGGHPAIPSLIVTVNQIAG